MALRISWGRRPAEDRYCDTACRPNSNVILRHYDFGMASESIEDRKERAIQLRLAGFSRSQIAQALGLKSGGAALSRWLKDVPPPEWTKRPNAKDDLRQKAIVMRQDGLSYNQIGEVLHVAKSTLSSWLRDIALTEEQRQALVNRRSDRRLVAIRAGHQERGASGQFKMPGTKSKLLRKANSLLRELLPIGLKGRRQNLGGPAKKLLS
jgi:transcriptional regulator with XRE-family HTH domain